jgi:uncharacterized coiled-coil protein SlyX
VEIDPECPYEQIMEELRELQYHSSIRDGMLKTISDLVGCPIRGKLVDAVEKALTKSDRIRELEENEKGLNKEVNKLRVQLRILEEQFREASGRATASARAISNVREALALPADVVNKARLFEARLGREKQLSRNKIILFLVDQAASMERTLEEMRVLADNMVPLEDLTARQQKDKQPAHPIPDSEAGPSSQPDKLVRKTTMVSESEEEEAIAAELEEEEEQPKLTCRPKYRTTPFGTAAAEVPVPGSPKSAAQQTPVSGSASTPAISFSPARVTPSLGGQRYSLRKQTPGSGR